MSDPNNLVFPGLGLLAGAVLLGIGFLKRYKAGRLAGYKRTATGHLRPGERQLISGPATGLAAFTSPVSKKPCIFYLEQTERLEVSHGRKGGAHSRWVKSGLDAVGGFKVDDGSGGVLVFPSASSPDFSRPEYGDDTTGLLETAGDVRKTEQVLLEGDNVTVIGTPVTLSVVLAAVRGGSQLNIPSDLMGALVKLEQAGGANTPCFFGHGAETVSDLAYEAYKADVSDSARLFLQAGGMIAVLSAAALLYALRSPGGGAAPNLDF